MAIAYVPQPMPAPPGVAGVLPAEPAVAPAPRVMVPAAASAPEDGTRSASAKAILWGFGLLAVGGALAWLADWLLDPQPFKVGSDMSVFAGLFVAAAAIERLLEPFTRFFGQVEDKKAKRDAAVAAIQQDDGAQNAASMQAALNQARADRSVMVWGLATGVSMVLSSACGFHLLYSIAAPGATPNVAIDILLTGLVIGGGTKPLHDVVSRVQKAKEKAEDPPETRG